MGLDKTTLVDDDLVLVLIVVLVVVLKGKSAVRVALKGTEFVTIYPIFGTLSPSLSCIIIGIELERGPEVHRAGVRSKAGKNRICLFTTPCPPSPPDSLPDGALVSIVLNDRHQLPDVLKHNQALLLLRARTGSTNAGPKWSTERLSPCILGQVCPGPEKTSSGLANFHKTNNFPLDTLPPPNQSPRRNTRNSAEVT